MERKQYNSEEPQTSWTPNFSKYLKDKWKRGFDIDQKPSDYVTEDILTDYWKEATVCDVLDNSYYKSIPIDAATILASFLRVWSTLVFIGRPQYITWFHENGRNDEYFYASSFSQTPDQDPSLQEMLKAFSQEWYKFWPVRFRSPIIHKRELDSQRVLPVVSSQRLSHPDSKSGTTIHEVILDPQCCENTNQKVVFKIYTDPGPLVSATFGKEVDIFATLGTNSKEVIVEYLGSFIQNGKRVIILEHANGGNLRDFFQSHRGPRNNDEMIQLWTKLFRLSDAVYHLHHDKRATVSVAHRDIKFENILVFKKEDNDDYEFHFKLTDFDTSTGPQKAEGGSSHQDNDGSRTRSAPEASRILDHTEHKSEMTPLDSDIWQLGTVFSEALVCIIWDYKSLRTYEDRRREETSSFQKLGDSGLEICFHDGEKRLACIQAIHQEALDGRPRFDRISEPLVALIEDHMLVPHEARLPAKMVSVKFAQLVERLRRESVVSAALPQSRQRQITHAQTAPGAVPGVRDILTEQDNVPQQEIRGSPSSHTIKSFDNGIDLTNGVLQQESEINGVLREEPLPLNDEDLTAKPVHNLSRGENELPTIKFPVVTANDVELWRMNKNKKQGASPPKGVREIIDQIQGREQVFVIDDAESMKDHLSDMIQMIRAMISLAKKADPNGVELIFTSAPEEVKKRSKFRFKGETRHLVDLINSRFRDGKLPVGTHMEDRLGTVLERVARSGKPTSVYVLTDGVWQDSDEPGGGVENPIKMLISYLNGRKRNRTAVAIQFIQFGDDAEGRKRLAWLDDKLPNSGESYLRRL